MLDTVGMYAIQFATITVGSMALSEWIKLPIGTIGSTRKRYSCLLYCIALGELGLWAELVTMPGDTWYKKLAGIFVMAIVSTGTAHMAISLKRKLGK